MNLNPIKKIHKFNKEANLLEGGYDDVRECAFPIEESLEGFNLDVLPGLLAMNPDEPCTPKDISRKIIWHTNGHNISDVERFDKHLDTIVFAFGSLFKLGLTPQQALAGLDAVMDANMTKLKSGKDDAGKQQKPKDFVGPEERLQRILDQR